MDQFIGGVGYSWWIIYVFSPSCSASKTSGYLRFKRTHIIDCHEVIDDRIRNQEFRTQILP